jgi:hypothetical protein
LGISLCRGAPVHGGKEKSRLGNEVPVTTDW